MRLNDAVHIGHTRIRRFYCVIVEQAVKWVLFEEVQTQQLEEFLPNICRNTLAVRRVEPNDLPSSFTLRLNYTAGYRVVCKFCCVSGVFQGFLVFVFSTVKLILRTGDGVHSLGYGDRDVLKDRWRVVGCFIDVFNNTIWLSVRFI